MKTIFVFFLVALVVSLVTRAPFPLQAANSQISKELSKEDILKHSPVKGGLLVHLGLVNSRLLLEFSAGSRFVCQGLSSDLEVRQRLLQELGDLDNYRQCSVDMLNQTNLPYADNLVRVLVVDDSCGVKESEFWRVLCPGGVLFKENDRGWVAEMKKRPRQMDEWTHARHGADGNFVSKDEYVGEPTNVRWISEADYDNSNAPQSTRVIVTSAGRFFVVTGAGERTYLRSQDAFSGVELWRRPYRTYKAPRLGHRDFWNFPSLIANGDTLFIAGQSLDASTGKERFKIDGDPLVCEDNVVVTSTMKAYDASTGKQLWQHPTPGLGLTIGDHHLYFIENEWPNKGGAIELVGLQLTTGKQAWRQSFDLPVPDVKRSAYDNYAPGSIPNGLLAGFIYHQGTLALEVTRTYIYLFSAKDGEHLRSLRYKNWSPYASGLRALMIDGKLWLPEAQEDFDFGFNINAYSLKDGEKVSSIKLATPIRQRCRPPLATEKFMFLGGLNTVNLSSGAETVRPIARSLCNFGLVPANGLIYVPPTHCRCYATLQGYIALESLKAGAQPVTANSTDHLIVGPSYGMKLEASNSDADWPQIRQSDMRRGHAETTLSASLKQLWESPVMGGSISSPVVSDNLVLVSEPDLHRISAFDVMSGKRRWSFVAGAPIDGPPTIFGNYAVFGSRDGWVYSLSLSSGNLVWKNMAAPAERLIMVNEELESAWPALGPVIIADNKVLAVAGRHNMAEAGILVSCFDLVSGIKRWQSAAPHRELVNPLTSGVYQRLYDKRRGVTETLPSAALLGGWLVTDGKSVQIDRLGAFDISTGKTTDLFDARIEEANTVRYSSYKNGSRKNDFDRWLLSAEDGLLQFFDAKQAPKNMVAIASTKDRWVVLTDKDLVLLDKEMKETFRSDLGQHNTSPHGVAVARGKVYISTSNGQILCFGP